jgi:hypothetical protein
MTDEEMTREEAETRCDVCGAVFVKGWTVPTGGSYEGKPVVKLICSGCHDRLFR